MHKSLLFFYILLFLSLGSLKAQLVLNQTYTPQQLVQNYLVGGGVTVSNVSYTGVTSGTCGQIAYFSNGNTTSLGMDAGILLTTGCNYDVPQSGAGFMSQDLGGSGVAELSSLLGGTDTYDGAVLEFDFVPLDNQVSFTYIFGSEEYPEYVCSDYNDVFAFFITGGPEGYSNQNIALIPSTNLPVAINSVNNGTEGELGNGNCTSLSYSSYYYDNNGSSNQPVFDGFTTPLDAIANVTPCQTYHLKICIADAYDGYYDSGVFLKRNSLSTDAIDLVVSYSSGSAPAGEGCSTATVTATIGNAPSSAVTVNYTIGGTASNADFTQPIPTSITIPAGQTSASITLNPVIDGLTEGNEYVVFSMPSGCGGVATDTVYIADNSTLSVNAGPDQTLCSSALPASLTATPTGGVPTYAYSWSNSAGSSQTVSVSPASQTQYIVTVTDACGQTAKDTVVVTVNPSPTSTFTATSQICAGDDVTVQYTGSASSAATYNWDFNGATIISGGTGQGPHHITWNTAGIYTISLTVTENGCTSQQSTQQVTVYALGSSYCCTMPTPNAGPDKTVCGLTTTLDGVNSMAGTWTSIPATASISLSSDPNSSVTVPSAGTYLFVWTESASASCTARDTVSITFYQVPNPNAGPDKTICGLSTALEGVSSMAGVWTAVPASATFGQVTNPTSSVTVTTEGTYLFIWTEASSATCIDKDTVSITFIQIPTVNAGSGGNVCSHTFQLSGTTNVGVGTWTSMPSVGVTFTDASNPNTSVDVTNDGIYTFVWTVDNNGCTSTSQNQVSFYAQPVANAGTDDATCSLSYNLQGSLTAGVGTWTGSGPGSVNFNGSNNPLATVTVSTTGQYTLIWSVDNHGCTDADTVVLLLTQTPTSTFTADTINCTGETSMITYTGLSSANATYTWSWDGGNAIPGTGSGPHVVSWTSTGVHAVSLTVSLNGCTSPQTTVNLLNPQPLSTSIVKTDILCNGMDNGIVNLTVTGGRLPYSYHWNNNANIEDLLSATAGIYTVTVTDASGCTKTDGTTIVEPNKLVVSVTPSQSICLGQPAYLSLTATGGVSPYQFYWNNQLANPSQTVSPTTETTYSAYVTDANGCTSNVLSTTVSVAPAIAISLTANTDHVCPGDQVMLTPVIDSSGIGPPYIIYNQEGDVVTPPIYIYPTDSIYYTVRVEDACGTFDTAGVNIVVWDLPRPSVLADTLQGCEPFTVHFNEESADSGQTYVWDFGDHSNLSLAKNPVHTYTSSGTFIVQLTVTSIHGCKTILMHAAEITVWPKPTAAYIWSPEVVTEIEPLINFTNMSTGAISYVWMFGDGDSSSIVNPNHRYPGKGVYESELIAISNKGCRDTALTPLKILEQYTFYAPSAFSPDGDRVNDYFYVVAHGIEEKDFYLEVYDRWGEVIWSTSKYSSYFEQSEKWDGRAKNGQIVPIGSYNWRVVFKDQFNRLHEETGAVNVIR